MCFAIPYKILAIEKNIAIIEDGRSILLDTKLHAKKNDYVQIIGNIAVGVLSKKQGLTIRKLIKSLN